jgi:hypothetical protein
MYLPPRRMQLLQLAHLLRAAMLLLLLLPSENGLAAYVCWELL